MLRSAARKFVFGPLETLRAEHVIGLLPRRLHDSFLRYLTEANLPGEAGSFLGEMLLLDAPSGPDLPPVLIGGPARVGKSSLARRLSVRLGYHVVNTDQFDCRFGSTWGEDEVWAFKSACVRRLLENGRVPVIVEGTHLITTGRCAHEIREARISLAWMDALERNGAVCLVVGSTGERMRKLRAIEERLSSCWTRTRSPRERWRIVRRLTFISRRVRREAFLRGVPYRELGTRTFRSELEAACLELEARVRSARGGADDPETIHRAGGCS